jgi:hypothetical protein
VELPAKNQSLFLSGLLQILPIVDFDHFLQNHSRIMPFLLPPPDFKPGELTAMGLTGTCELQICRSAGPWSMGTPSRIEHSIQNAYLKGILLVQFLQQ